MRANASPHLPAPSRRLACGLLTAAAVLVPGSGAYAAAPALRSPPDACVLVETVSRSALSSAWGDAVIALGRELSSAPPASCHGVPLTLTADGDHMLVSALAPDGSVATRVVLKPAALSAIAFGLLAIAPSEPVPVPPEPLEVPPLPEPVAPRPGPPAPFEQDLRVSVSAAGGVRGGLPTRVIMADFEVRADLAVHQWLINVSARVAPVSASSRLPIDEDAYNEASIALGIGRELRAGRSAFALTGGPGFTYIWMENDPLNIAVEHAQFRLGAAARWGYAVARRLRINVTLDAELAPSALGDQNVQPGLAPYPSFTAGFRIGAETVL
jgi:hypothetical protein